MAQRRLAHTRDELLGCVLAWLCHKQEAIDQHRGTGLKGSATQEMHSKQAVSNARAARVANLMQFGAWLCGLHCQLQGSQLALQIRQSLIGMTTCKCSCPRALQDILDLGLNSSLSIQKTGYNAIADRVDCMRETMAVRSAPTQL